MTRLKSRAGTVHRAYGPDVLTPHLTPITETRWPLRAWCNRNLVFYGCWDARNNTRPIDDDVTCNRCKQNRKDKSDG